MGSEGGYDGWFPRKENVKPVRRPNDHARNGAAVEEYGDEEPVTDDLMVDGQKAWIQNFWAAYDALGSK